MMSLMAELPSWQVIGRSEPFNWDRIYSDTNQYRTFNVLVQGRETGLPAKRPSGAEGLTAFEMPLKFSLSIGITMIMGYG